jgi:hypothetical protein
MKPSPGQVHHVTAADRGQTLAAFLRARLGGASWGRVQKMIRSRHVMIHGNICTDTARRLKDAGGLPAHGNVTTNWDLSRAEDPNPEYR